MINKYPWKIEMVIRKTGCTKEKAIDYLDAEEWDELDAIISLQGDEEGIKRTLQREQIKEILKLADAYAKTVQDEQYGTTEYQDISNAREELANHLKNLKA
jgi:hypothetical protein